MSRRVRKHIRGGFYYVVKHTDHPLILSGSDFEWFIHRLAHVLPRYNAQCCGLSCGSDAIRMIVHVHDQPVWRIMQSLWVSWSKQKNHRIDESLPHGRHRPHVALIEARCLIDLVCCLHQVALVEPSTTEVPAERRHQVAMVSMWTSQNAYLQNENVDWLDRTAVFRMLSTCESEARRMYCERMLQPLSERAWRLFEDLDGKSSINLAGANVSVRPRSDQSLRAIARIHISVASMLGLDAEMILSRRRTSELVFARAWIAARVVSSRVASVSQVAKYLGRSRSDIHTLIKRYEQKHPYFFRNKMFPAGCGLL